MNFVWLFGKLVLDILYRQGGDEFRVDLGALGLEIIDFGELVLIQCFFESRWRVRIVVGVQIFGLMVSHFLQRNDVESFSPFVGDFVDPIQSSPIQSFDGGIGSMLVDFFGRGRRLMRGFCGGVSFWRSCFQSSLIWSVRLCLRSSIGYPLIAIWIPRFVVGFFKMSDSICHRFCDVGRLGIQFVLLIWGHLSIFCRSLGDAGECGKFAGIRKSNRKYICSPQA